jgi:hypothetical protein
MMLTDDEIDAAKVRTAYGDKAHHEHPDCIRMAYEWLDAQPKTKRPIPTPFALKHIIEAWAGRYVSQTDVEVAAEMHPDIIGRYPYFNISKRMVLPNAGRLDGIDEAGHHPSYREKNMTDVYGNRAEI